MGTYEKYKTSFDHLKRFLSFQYKLEDIYPHDLNYSFATDYEFNLKTVRNCSHNTSLNSIKNLKAFINFAERHEWIKNKPLGCYQTKLEHIEKEFISET